MAWSTTYWLLGVGIILSSMMAGQMANGEWGWVAVDFVMAIILFVAAAGSAAHDEERRHQIAEARQRNLIREIRRSK